jgi:hypothetical protein
LWNTSATATIVAFQKNPIDYLLGAMPDERLSSNIINNIVITVNHWLKVTFCVQDFEQPK